MPVAYVTVCYPDEHFIATKLKVKDTNNHDAILEQVFAEWNAGSGQECELFKRERVRSFSVNDVVIIHTGEGNVYYQCASVGWNRISESEFNELERAVATHPSRFTDGAWFALIDVMRPRRKQQPVTA